MLGRWTVHVDSCRRGQIHADFRRIVHPDFVFDDLCVEPSIAKFLRDVVGGGFVLGRARHMRSFRQYAKVFFRKLGVRHREEACFDGGFRGSITESEQNARPEHSLSTNFCLEFLPNRKQ